MNRLESFGWNPFFEQQVPSNTDPEWRPARVYEEQRGSWALWWEEGSCRATVAGRLRHESEGEPAAL
ncbi:MAG TPA: hypothetical protein VFT93_08525, partial [Candidatus Eisenbacteria bacterium]|nr:hypothetical protein [Candidatus Eisenbacteria bacterium]